MNCLKWLPNNNAYTELRHYTDEKLLCGTEDGVLVCLDRKGVVYCTSGDSSNGGSGGGGGGGSGNGVSGGMNGGANDSGGDVMGDRMFSSETDVSSSGTDLGFARKLEVSV